VTILDDEPPSRNHRPLVSVVFLIVVFSLAALFVFETSAKNAAVAPGRALSVLIRLPASNAQTRFSIDTVLVGEKTYTVAALQPRIEVPSGVPLRVGGWAVDDKADAPGSGVRIYLDNGTPINAQYGISRPDVAKVLRDARLTLSGFEALVPTTGLTQGQHELSFQIVNAAGTGTYALPKRIQFTIRAGAAKE
jgi:hypothetical protein